MIQVVTDSHGDDLSNDKDIFCFFVICFQCRAGAAKCVEAMSIGGFSAIGMMPDKSQFGGFTKGVFFVLFLLRGLRPRRVMHRCYRQTQR
ncbi:hypothetical protein [Burkholderia vietnamiensis]|uniref:hypothetical protein n=1 Tax=Burkholderia vietnamiensis TaxID=60552 RepID=UPI001D13A30D|nr:hypothetical protein [Burkholderia vietnamiensis]UEC05616.1 hypothetical protein LK462_34840 [Burkholderia vietnamiensis]